MKIKNFIIIIIILGIIAISFINIGLFNKKSTDSLYNNLEIKYGKGYSVYIKNLDCNALTNKIKYIDTNYFIDENEYLYYYNVFNNNYTCNIVNSEQKFKYIIDNKFFVSNNNQIFYIDDNVLIEANKQSIINSDNELDYEASFLKQVTIDNPNATIVSKPYLGNDWQTLINNIKMNNDETIIIYTIENEKLYILKYKINISNNIINYSLNSKESYDINTIDNSEKILNIYYEISPYNEKIYNINFPTIIKTDKAFYMINVNDKNCLMSTDIECKFDFYKSKILTDNYSNIAYVDNQVIIGYNLVIYPLFSELYQYFD